MQKWEYCLVITYPPTDDRPLEISVKKTGQPREIIKPKDSPYDEAISVMGKLGQERWEAVGFHVQPPGQFVYLLKRSIEE
jgi:hypothetical protein